MFSLEIECARLPVLFCTWNKEQFIIFCCKHTALLLTSARMTFTFSLVFSWSFITIWPGAAGWHVCFCLLYIKVGLARLHWQTRNYHTGMQTLTFRSKRNQCKRWRFWLNQVTLVLSASTEQSFDSSYPERATTGKTTYQTHLLSSILLDAVSS